MKLTEKEFNAITGEETVIEREETKSEKDLRLKLEAEFAAELAAEEAKATAKAALLEKLGITSEEASLLLS
jgi:hypothetical protein